MDRELIKNCTECPFKAVFGEDDIIKYKPFCDNPKIRTGMWPVLPYRTIKVKNSMQAEPIKGIVSWCPEKDKNGLVYLVGVK